MIINQPKSEIFGSQVETNSFSIKSSPKAFQILSSNLYSNKIRAVIREYSCNALDAHRYAKKENEPFQVTLPSELQQNFIVRDFGNGLSEQEIKELFTTYFGSSKDQSNDFTGALGLGSKSAFSYTDSFNCTSYHNGTKSVYSLFLDQGEPKVTLMYQSESNEPSGVEINIPVQYNDIYSFENEAQIVYSAFDVKPIGFENKTSIHYYCKDFGTINLQKSSISRDEFAGKYIYARMGNVLYPISSEYTKNYRFNLEIYGFDSWSNIIFVDFNIGELDIAPSREQLSYDKTTIENIDNKLNQIFENTISKMVEFHKDEVNKESWFKFGKSIAEITIKFHGLSRFTRACYWMADSHGIQKYLLSLTEKINGYTYKECKELTFKDVINDSYYNNNVDPNGVEIKPDPVTVYSRSRSLNRYKPVRNGSNYIDQVMHTDLYEKPQIFFDVLWYDMQETDVVIVLDKSDYKRRKPVMDYLVNEYSKTKNGFLIISANPKICDDIKKFLETKYKNTELVLLDLDDNLEQKVKDYISSLKPETKDKPQKTDPMGTIFEINKNTFDKEGTTKDDLTKIDLFGIKDLRAFVADNPDALFVPLYEGWYNLRWIFNNSGFNDISTSNSQEIKNLIGLAEPAGKKVYGYMFKDRCSNSWYDVIKPYKYDLQMFLSANPLGADAKDIYKPLIKLGFYNSYGSWESYNLKWDFGVFNLGRFVKLNDKEQIVYEQLKDIARKNAFWIEPNLDFFDSQLDEMEIDIPFYESELRNLFTKVLELDKIRFETLNETINKIISKIKPLEYIKEILGEFGPNNVSQYSDFLGDSDSCSYEEQVKVYESFNKMMKNQQEVF